MQSKMCRSITKISGKNIFDFANNSFFGIFDVKKEASANSYVLSQPKSELIML